MSYNISISGHIDGDKDEVEKAEKEVLKQVRAITKKLEPHVNSSVFVGQLIGTHEVFKR